MAARSSASSHAVTCAPPSDEEARARLAPLLAEFGGSGLLLAVSGGPDSVALMRLLAPLAHAAGAAATVATIDHGLRPGSAADAQAVAGWAAECGLPCMVRTWTGEKPERGLQDAARAARYALLVAAAREVGARAVLTAHHRDDQAETVLMRLCAGSGLAGLAGMRPRGARAGLVLARPFLDLPKARLVAACAARGWPHLDDPSNSAERFARARLRRIAPHLAAEGLDAARLARLAGRAARADDALEQAAASAYARVRIAAAPVTLDAAALLAEPEEIALRVLARALREGAPRHGGEEARERLSRLEALWARLAPALAAARPLRATLAGALLEARGGRVRIGPEPPRRGRR